MSLDGFSLAPLVKELDQSLAGGRIDKIFQPNKNIVMIWIRQPGTTYRLHIDVNGEHPHIKLSRQALENPDVPPVFCMVLRKHLEDGRISSIVQHNLDRILVLTIDIRGQGGIIVSKQLMIEIMGKHSNIILTEDNQVIDAIHRIGSDISRIRHIFPGKPYLLPPGQDKLNILNTSIADFVTYLKNTQSGALAKALIAAGQGLGPVTAKEILWRAGLPQDIGVAALDNADLESLASAIQSLIAPLRTNQIAPTVITDSHQRLLGMAAFSIEYLEHLENNQIHRFTTMSDAVDFASKLSIKYTPPAKDILKKLVIHELNKLEKKLLILTTELEQANQAEECRKFADILMTNLSISFPGTDKITLPDIYSDDPSQNQISIAVDPELSLLDNAKYYYARYNKLKRAQSSLTHQVKQTQGEIQYLFSIEIGLDTADNSSDILDIRGELIASGYIKQSKKQRPPTRQSRPLKISTSDGLEILIGKNNVQNDEITFKTAQLNDIWLHVKDFPGSHVVIRNSKQSLSDDVLYLAAQFAAFFSKAKMSAKVPVDYTKRRNVKKPSGSKPGFVTYSAQKTLYITPDHQLIEQILKEQEKG